MSNLIRHLDSAIDYVTRCISRLQELLLAPRSGPSRKVVANERIVLDRLSEFTQNRDVPCDFNLTTAFDTCLTAEFAAYEAETFTSFKNAGGDVSYVKFSEGEEARKRTGVKETVAAHEEPAASMHPAKLAQWLLATVMNRRVTLFTHFPVLKVERSSVVDSKEWQVHTPRGTSHCSNSHLLNECICVTSLDHP